MSIAWTECCGGNRTYTPRGSINHKPLRGAAVGLTRLEGKELPYNAFAFAEDRRKGEGLQDLCTLFKARATLVDLALNSSDASLPAVCVELVGSRFLRRMVRNLVVSEEVVVRQIGLTSTQCNVLCIRQRWCEPLGEEVSESPMRNMKKNRNEKTCWKSFVSQATGRFHGPSSSSSSSSCTCLAGEGWPSQLPERHSVWPESATIGCNWRNSSS